MTDLEHELAAAANAIPMNLGDVDKVTALGRRRRARRRGALSGVTALALVAGLATLVNLDPQAGTPVATAANLSRGDVDFEWEVLSTSDGLGMSGSDVNGAGPFYALSTAAGRADVGKNRPSRVLWRSDDGVSWTAATTLGNDLFLSDLAPADGRVYAVGTAPAQAGAKRRGDLVAGWSDDGGKTFSKKTLPIDWAAIEASSLTTQLVGTQIAANDTGTVVTATVQAALDVPRLLPQGTTAPDGWATTATGVDVLGPEKEQECPAGTQSARAMKMVDANGSGIAVPAGTKRNEEADTRPKSREIDPEWCVTNDDKRETVAVSPQEARGVVRSFTWSELGVSGDLLGAATRQLFGFFAPKGSSDFTRVDLGGARADMAFVDADENGFHVFATSNAPGRSTAETVDLSSENGKTWKSTAGPSDLQWVSAAGTVGGRRLVIGDSASGTMVARADGAGGWAVTPLSSVIDPALSGGRPVHSFAAGVGPLGVVIAAMAEADPNKSDVASTVLAFSRDGSTWEDQSVEQIAGRKVGMPLRIFVTGQRAVVALSGGSAAEGAPAKPQTILVGTPA